MPTIRDRIVRRVSHDPAAVRVVVFLAEDPDGWFDTEAIQARARVPTRMLKHLLDELVDDGFLIRRRDGEVNLCALTRHREVRDAVLYMVDRPESGRSALPA